MGSAFSDGSPFTNEPIIVVDDHAVAVAVQDNEVSRFTPNAVTCASLRKELSAGIREQKSVRLWDVTAASSLWRTSPGCSWSRRPQAIVRHLVRPC